MTVHELIDKLKAIDSKIRFVVGPNKQSGIYKFQPKHPDAHENGLRWIGACPSPHMFFGKLQEFDWYDTAHGASEYHRGWRKIVNLLVAHGHIKGHDANEYFGIKWHFPSKPKRD